VHFAERLQQVMPLIKLYTALIFNMNLG